MSVRRRLGAGLDRMQAGLIEAAVLGPTLAFGGAVWWARPAVVALTALLALAAIARAALGGGWRALKSPLGALAGLVLVLGAVQLVPLPPALAGRLAPRARAAHALGVLPDRVAEDDPGRTLPDPGPARTPITVDRAATLRWLVGAVACFALFRVAAGFADRLGRALVIWGGVVAALFVSTAFACVQVLGGTPGLYGFLEPGRAPAWAPSTADLMASPNETVLREVAPAGDPAAGAWAVPEPDRPAAVGGMLGGPGAFLAFGSLALPLALALALQAIAPRGSREPLRARLSGSRWGGLAVLGFGLTVASALLVGLLAGWWLSGPFALGVVLAGVPGARASGLRWVAIGATAAVLLALAAGVGIGDAVAVSGGADAVSAARRPGLEASRAVWADAARIARDFPALGAGLGSFAALEPYYKRGSETSTTARSSLLQWWAEAGWAGLAVLGSAGLWVLARLPGAIRRVGTGDRMLAFGLVGAVAGFGAFSAVHWTLELPAVALAASAVAGTCDRWLAGGTDLFVEPT